ncbi:CBO0543 family protein [Clostridium sp. C8-1-8]|uniref:CBO0543 family protein n=1 Tax=Clostridium sp. C8-1-8 TaxID=2698831 RepID=UPI00136AC533|nr:CBO0543 family protein [Clostridium sp. C8-1-8]
MNIVTLLYLLEIVFIVYSLFKFIPKEKRREAIAVYTYTLTITWFFGLMVAEFNLIEYPIRQFPEAIKTSFLFEYFLFPSICALFVVNYPEMKSKLRKFLYYLAFCSILTIIEMFEERYTLVLKYIFWDWYVTWITFYITFYACYKYKKWFFKKYKLNN